MNTTQPRACPFCGCDLQWQEGNLKVTPPLFPLWRHPRNGCFAEMFAVVPEDVGEFRGGSWSVFGGPLHENMQVVGWWPLPERE